MSKGNVAATLVLAVAAFLAMPASSQTTAPQTVTPPVGAASGEQLNLKGPVTDLQRSTIATITDLAQQLKIEQLKRDLREARQTSSSSSATDAAIAKVNALAVPAAGSPTAVPVSAAQERQPPVVAAIFGMGGHLRVRLQDGRELVSGQEAQGWIINAVTPNSVSFSHCARPKKGAAKGECVTRLVSASGI